MKLNGNLLSWFGGLGLLGAVACAAPEAADVDTDEGEVARAEQPALDYHHGGWGGIELDDWWWGHVDGIQTQTGAYVDNIRVHIAHPIKHWLRAQGGNAGELNPAQVCSNYAIGIYGRSGDLLDGIGVICGDLDQNNAYVTPYTGGSGGAFFFDLCPVGTMITNVHLWVSDVVNAIEIGCGEPCWICR